MVDEEKGTDVLSNDDEMTGEKDSSQDLSTVDEVSAKQTTKWTDDEVNFQAAAMQKGCSVKPWKTRLMSFHGSLYEILILTPVMLVIIGLFLLPTVFYALPLLEVNKGANKTERDCLLVANYSGEVCREVFTSLQTCFSGVTSPPPALSIPSAIDQQMEERDAMNLVNGLTFLNPSPQCMEAVIPFLCLSIFTLCDSSNRLHTILREDCLELRDNICAEEWSEAIGFLGTGVLPICEDLPDMSDECIGNTSLPTPLSSTLNPLHGVNKTTRSSQLVCSEGFLFDENKTNLCRPTCGEFNTMPLNKIIIKRIAVSICFIASVIMFILALTKQRKTLLVFPSILFLYLCITTFVASGVVIIGFFDNVALYCGSRDFINTTEKGNETPFCTFSGFVFNYCLEQVAMWAVLHAIYLVWAVRYPFSYRQLKISGRIRYAHIISVVLAVVLPLVGPCILLRDGYIVTSTPSEACVGRNLDVTYYAIILPVSFVVGTTSCLLSLFFWTLFKELTLKKLLTGSKVANNIAWKAQLKIACTVIFYTLLGVMGLVLFSYTETNDTYQESIREYILCESGGKSNCDLDLGINDDVHSVIITVIYLMISFLPVLAILFSCDPRACMRKSRLERRSTLSTKIGGTSL